MPVPSKQITESSEESYSLPDIHVNSSHDYTVQSRKEECLPDQSHLVRTAALGSAGVRFDREQCLSIIPHIPNFINNLGVIEEADGKFRVSFSAIFPSDWEFLTARIFHALPNSVMIEVLAQAAMMAFKAMGISGLPATAFMREIFNHNPFFNWGSNLLDGEFIIKDLRNTRRGVRGTIHDAILKEDETIVMTLLEAGFVVLEGKGEDGKRR